MGFIFKWLSMGNSKRRKQRQDGIMRQGPNARAFKLQRQENQRLLRVEAARLRQSWHRVTIQEAKEISRALAAENPGGEEDDMSEQSKHRVSLWMAQYIVEELKSCLGPRSKREVLEKLLNHNTISPLLSEYYPRPAEARATFMFIESFRIELQAVMTGHSRDTLARKGALMDAAVSTGFQRLGSLYKVLQTSPSNINAALERRLRLDAPSFALLMRKKQPGLSEYIRSTVRMWWHQHTRVSPNKKDVTRHCVGPKEYDEHPTHYLTDTQANHFSLVWFLKFYFSFYFATYALRFVCCHFLPYYVQIYVHFF
jgi:hypothetical protein